MDTDDRASDQHVLEVSFTFEHVKQPIKNSGLGPTAKTPENTVPMTKENRQITPGRPRPYTP